MSLSERLAQAAAARGTASVAPRPANQGAEVAIDEAGPGIEPGVPAPCPDCGGPGYLERIDLASNRQLELCRPCGTRWSRPI